MSGPVSSALEQEVLGELRRKGLVVWLDKDAIYTRFVDELCAKQKKGDFLFDVVAFRGSFLELLFQLEPFGSGLEKPPLLIHLPGFNEDSVRKTPLLELYEAGTRFRKALDTLIREAATSRVTPADVEAFAASPTSLEEADAWLAAAISRNAFGLAAVLDEFGPSLLAEALAEPNASLSARITSPADEQTLRDYLHKLVGLDDAWFDFVGGAKQRKGLEHVLAALAAWALCVEYVHDLKRPAHLPALQRLRALSAPLVKACRELVTQLRRSSPEAYAQRADETEAFLAEELSAMTPDDLGQVDTFREEENRVLAGAVEALGQGAWSKARAWCEARQGDKSFWLQRDQTRRLAWSFVAEAAEFGETLARHPRPFEGVRSLEEAAERYASSAFEVDRVHRRFEQERLRLLESSLPHFGPLQEVVITLRKAHRAWADRLARDFASLCKEHGFLPPASHQQRTLYEQIVHPLTLGGEKVAFLVIDAFRYEMATELADELNAAGAAPARSGDDPGVSVDLKPRLAELPTITSVGMNALAPVAREGGRLAVAGAFQGFKAGEFTVRRPEDRARAMGERSAGKAALLLKLAEVCEASTPALAKKIKPHRLIVVHSKEIDDAGEANLGLPTFDSTLRQIKAAWHHLQLAGVKQFVFTADHGFLLQDETTEVRPFGTKRDPQRRHVLDEHPRAEAGMVNVSLSSLGYEGLSGYLLFRDDTAAFATGNAGATFVHGGNSPQERIIPVLRVTQKRVEPSSLAEYAVEVEPQPAVLGLHRVRLRVVFSKRTTASLGFAAVRAVDVALRAPGRELVRILIREVTGPAELKAGHVRVPVGGAWSEVFFALEGPADDRVRVEVYHPDKVEQVQSATTEEWYSVTGKQVAAGSQAPSTRPPPPPASWADGIADAGARQVFAHIEKHGAITEPEITKMLGSPRAFRRFSLEFDHHLAKLPFDVHTEAGEGGKRYVRGGDR